MKKEMSNIICAATVGASIVLAVLVYGLFSRYDLTTMYETRRPIVIDHFTGKCFIHPLEGKGTNLFIDPR